MLHSIIHSEFRNLIIFILKSYQNSNIANIIESVDSICRDGADTPIKPKSNGSELPNADVLSLFKQITCSASVSIH